MEDESPLCGDELHHEDSGLVLDENGEDLHKDNRLNTEVSVRGGSRCENVARASGTTWYKAAFLIINAALGAGLVNFPQAFDETGGIISGNVAHVVFVCFAFGSLIILAFCATENNCKTYQEVVKHFCGPNWGVVSSVCITLYCFVACVTFIIIIGDQFDRAFASYFGSDFCHHWYMNRKFTMVVSSLLLIFPCCFKRIDGMEFMSFVGVASIFYLVMVIVVEMVRGSYIKGEILIFDVNFFTFFNVVPTVCFGYQCHVSSVPILSCLKRRDKPAIMKACVAAILTCFVVYTVSANCGYLTFGSYISSDVLLNYQAKRMYVLLAVLLLAIKSWTTYPILLFCVREAVADIYLGLRKISSVEASLTEPKRRKVIATLLWIASIICAVFVPGLNTVIKLLGSLAGVFIFIFPGMFYLNMTLSRYDACGLRFGLKIVLAVVYIVVGVFTLGLSFTLGIEGFLNSENDEPICIIPSLLDLF